MANTIDISIDTKALKNKIEQLKNTLNPTEINRAIYLGVNVSSAKVRTLAAKEIRTKYNIRYSYLTGSYIGVKKANPGKLSAEIAMSIKPISISEFLKSRANKSGISVQIIKGHTEVIHGAFIFASHYSTSTRLSIMHRSNVTGGSSYNGSFQFRHHRINPTGKDLPIGAMFSVSPLHSVFNETVSNVIRTQGGKILEEQILLKLDQMASGLIRNARNRGGRPFGGR